MQSQKESQNRIGAGGTPGGVGAFFFGFALASAGAWLLTSQTVVSSDPLGFLVPGFNFRMNTFGLSYVPFILGIGFLFFDGKSFAGRLLTGAGLVIILVGILMSLHFYFQPTFLFNTLTMLLLLFGGLGLIFRSIKAAPEQEEGESSRVP